MLGSSSLFLLPLVGSGLLGQVGSASHPEDTGWREPGFGMRFRALWRLRLMAVGVPGACGAALWVQHQSPHLIWDSRTQPGHLPQGQITPTLLPGQRFLLAYLRQQQIWEKSVSFLPGKVESQGSPVAMVAADHPQCNITSSHSASRCAAAGKQSNSPRCEHGMAGNTGCPLCSHSLPWDAACTLGCVSPPRTLPSSKKPIGESSDGEGEVRRLH